MAKKNTTITSFIRRISRPSETHFVIRALARCLIIFAQTAEIYIARVILHPNCRYLCIVDVYNQTQNKTKKAH